jgi:hypothetical protein
MSRQILGIGVSRGIAIGRAHRLAPSELDIRQYQIDRTDVLHEVARLNNAFSLVRAELDALRADVAVEAPQEVRAFLDLHRLILDDALLSDAPRDLVRSRLINAEWALSIQIEMRKVRETEAQLAEIKEAAAIRRQAAEAHPGFNLMPVPVGEETPTQAQNRVKDTMRALALWPFGEPIILNGERVTWTEKKKEALLADPQTASTEEPAAGSTAPKSESAPESATKSETAPKPETESVEAPKGPQDPREEFKERFQKAMELRDRPRREAVEAIDQIFQRQENDKLEKQKRLETWWQQLNELHQRLKQDKEKREQAKLEERALDELWVAREKARKKEQSSPSKVARQ